MSIGNHGTLEISYAKSARVGPLGKRSSGEFIGQFTRGVVGVVSAKRVAYAYITQSKFLEARLACAKLPTESNCSKFTNYIKIILLTLH